MQTPWTWNVARRSGVAVANLRGWKIKFSIGIALLSAPSFAEDRSPSNYINEVSVDHLSFEQRVHLNYIVEYHGPSVASPFGNYQVVDGVPQGTPLAITQTASFTYQASQDVSLWVKPSWDFQPGVVVPFFWDDLALGTSQFKLYDHDHGLVSANVVAILPTSHTSIDNAMIAALGSDQVFQYSVPRSRVTLGTNTNFKVYAFSELSESNVSQNFVTFYAGPFVKYQFTKVLTLGSQYEMNWGNTRESDLFAYVPSTGTDLKLWANADFTESTHLCIYFLFYPAADVVTLASTSFGIVLNQALF